MKGTPGRWTILLLMVCIAGCASAPTRPESIGRGDYAKVAEYVSALVRYEMKKRDVTGLSIALVDGQRVVWAEGFGYADKAGNVPASRETVYRVGSISKLFTATAAMQLAERGKLDIDRPLQDYLPEFSMRTRFPAAAPVTPRSIMTHHSGLPSDHLKGMWTRNPEPFTRVADRLGDEYAANPPGAVFSYSNLGVTLLGDAIGKAAGRDFASHIRDEILLPLGMNNSSFSPSVDRTPLAAKGYRKGAEAEDPPLRDVPAGGLNTSVLDLSRFIRMVFTGGKGGDRQVVKPETLAEMLRPQNAEVPLDLDLRVGLGWMLGGPGDIDIRNGGPVAYHAGATLLFHGQIIVLPEQKLGVVVLANSDTAGRVVGKVAAEALKLALEAKTGIRQPEREKPVGGEVPLSPEALQRYEGWYATPVGAVNVRKASGGLRADIMNRTLRLIPRADGSLGLQYRLLGIFPIRIDELEGVGISRSDVAGREILAARMHGREFPIGERLQPVPVPAQWLGRTGEYEIANPGEDAVLPEKVRLRAESGFLFVDYSIPLLFPGTASFAIAPVSDDEAVIRGFGRGMGETVRAVTENGESMLSYSGYLLRKKGKRLTI
ncbi:MAG: beta-lactamase family protein [Deltaproteobacteria bacterium]|nr:beta-lactamase family protein [Deltaproteobacteria bacterium]